MDREEFDRLLREYVDGCRTCNTPEITIRRNEAIIRDFYYTKLELFFKVKGGTDGDT